MIERASALYNEFGGKTSFPRQEVKYAMVCDSGGFFFVGIVLFGEWCSS